MKRRPDRLPRKDRAKERTRVIRALNRRGYRFSHVYGEMGSGFSLKRMKRILKQAEISIRLKSQSG